MTIKNPIQVLAVATIALAAGGVLTALEYRMLWGYWWRPESVVVGMKADRIEAIYQLREASRGELEPSTEAVMLSGLCGGSALGSCVEGKTLLELLGTNFTPGSIPSEIDRATWARLWNVVRTHNQSETAAGLGTPASGIAIQFTSAGTRYAWIKYSTHELEGDWHRTIQLLYALRGNQPELVRWNSYRYEIAGLEDTPTWLLWVINTAILAVPFAVRMTEGSGSTRRAYRILKAVGSALFLLIGSALGLIALSGVQQHDPWLVVILIMAALMIAAGVYVTICFRARDRAVA